ncbi:MAG: flagellar basal body P-ring formation chaperone FlgA [Paracoccaceae bacterium]|jgi:flagella basal body P-ring formation protein FlgA
MKLVFLVALIVLPSLAQADSVLARRTLRAQTVISAADLQQVSESYAGAISDPAEAIGLETRVAIYAGAPVSSEALQPPAVISRNQVVDLVFRRGGLLIRTEGRALDRAASGETIRIMNVASKVVLRARVQPNGEAHVLSE